jgi:hypothetical protein
VLFRSHISAYICLIPTLVPRTSCAGYISLHSVESQWTWVFLFTIFMGQVNITQNTYFCQEESCVLDNRNVLLFHCDAVGTYY